MDLKKYYLALDLIDDEQLIEQYKEHHRAVFPEIIESIKSAGIEELEIYNVGNRLVMVMTVNDTFSFEKKAAMDEANPSVQRWEKLMWEYQQALPMAKEGEKWMLMERIFQL